MTLVFALVFVLVFALVFVLVFALPFALPFALHFDLPFDLTFSLTFDLTILRLQILLITTQFIFIVSYYTSRVVNNILYKLFGVTPLGFTLLKRPIC
jgi:uncharacterized membrane protein YesL